MSWRNCAPFMCRGAHAKARRKGRCSQCLCVCNASIRAMECSFIRTTSCSIVHWQALQQAHTEWKWCRSSVDLSNSCMCCSFRPIDGYWLKNRFTAFICNINFTWNIPSVHSVWVYVIFVANSMKSDGYCKALYVWVHTSRWKALAAGRQTEGTTIISIFPFINYFNYAA